MWLCMEQAPHIPREWERDFGTRECKKTSNVLWELVVKAWTEIGGGIRPVIAAEPIHGMAAFTGA